jgi:hypothetical protein
LSKGYTAEKTSVSVKQGRTLKIFNGQVITPYRTIKNGTVIAVDGIITEVREGNIDVPGAEEIDANGPVCCSRICGSSRSRGWRSRFSGWGCECFFKGSGVSCPPWNHIDVPDGLSGDVDTLLENLDIYEEATVRMIPVHSSRVFFLKALTIPWISGVHRIPGI